MSTKRNDRAGRSKEFVKCWNCNAFVGVKLLKDDDYGDQCPLCEAVGLRED